MGLVLSRKKDEIIECRIGDIVIEIMVIEIRGDKVRLRVDAPNHVVIHRKEIWMKLDLEEDVACCAPTTDSCHPTPDS